MKNSVTPTIRLTETARLLRNNVRRVFGTGNPNRSHSTENKELELKRKYFSLFNKCFWFFQFIRDEFDIKVLTELSEKNNQ